MIDLSPQHLALVQSILKQHVPNREVWIFGSRVAGQVKKYSDIDLVILGDERVPRLTLAHLEYAFQTSELPYRVDVIVWASTSESFRKIILKKHEIVQRK